MQTTYLRQKHFIPRSNLLITRSRKLLSILKVVIWPRDSTYFRFENLKIIRTDNENLNEYI